MDNLDTLTIGVKFDVKKFAASAQQIESIVDKLTNKIYDQFSTTFNFIGEEFNNLSKNFKWSKDSVKDMQKVIKELNTKTNRISIKINTKEIKSGTKEIENDALKTVKNINSIFSKLFTSLGIGFSLKATSNFLIGINKIGSQLQFIGNISNVNTTKLQEYRQAIDAMGGNAEEVTGQIQALYSSLTEAAISGNPDLAKWLGGLGIVTRDANNNLINLADIIEDILNKVHDLKKEQRLPALNRFGVSGLLPLANLSNAQRKQKLDSFRISTLSQSQLDAARAEQEKWTQIFQKWQKIGANINTVILPIFDRFTTLVDAAISTLLGDSKGFIQRNRYTPEEANKYLGRDGAKLTSSRNLIIPKMDAKTQQMLDKFDKDYPINGMVPPIIIPNSSNINNQHIGTQQHNQNVSLNIQNLNLPEATNPKEFAQSITKMSQTGWGFSGSRLA